MATWLDEHQADPGHLPAALRVRARGGVSHTRRELLAERDALLRRLHQGTTYADLSPLAAAKLITQDFKTYERRRWARESKGYEAPAVEPVATFWRLLRTGMKMPNPKYLKRILENPVTCLKVPRGSAGL